MIENEFYSRAVHGPYETFNIGDLVLEDGGTLRQCKLAYASFGKLTSKETARLPNSGLSADPTAEALSLSDRSRSSFSIRA